MPSFTSTPTAAASCTPRGSSAATRTQLTATVALRHTVRRVSLPGPPPVPSLLSRSRCAHGCPAADSTPANLDSARPQAHLRRQGACPARVSRRTPSPSGQAATILVPLLIRREMYQFVCHAAGPVGMPI